MLTGGAALGAAFHSVLQTTTRRRPGAVLPTRPPAPPRPAAPGRRNRPLGYSREVVERDLDLARLRQLSPHYLLQFLHDVRPEHGLAALRADQGGGVLHHPPATPVLCGA